MTYTEQKVQAVQPRSIESIKTEAELFLEAFRKKTIEIANKKFALPIGYIEYYTEELLGVNFEVQELVGNQEGGITEDNSLVLSESVYIGLLAHDPRSRFTAAHEVGHAVLHKNQINCDKSKIVYARRKNLPAYSDPEWQANEFAANLLMPEKLVRHVIKEHSKGDFRIVPIESLISNEFIVSFSAAQRRLRRLKVRDYNI